MGREWDLDLDAVDGGFSTQVVDQADRVRARCLGGKVVEVDGNAGVGEGLLQATGVLGRRRIGGDLDEGDPGRNAMGRGEAREGVGHAFADLASQSVAIDELRGDAETP